MDLSGRVALVTGSAVRVGRAIALGLAGAGADVFIHYGRSAGPATEVAEEIRSLGVRAETGSADLSDPANASGVVRMASDALGPVTLLVNSASGFAEDTLEGLTLSEWRQSHDLTLAAPVFLTQAFAAALDGDETGAVVNITDVKTATPYRQHFSYVVAKGGLDAFTRAAALALAPSIRVNAAALGVILPPPGRDDAYANELASRLPMLHPGGTDPVVATVLYLLGNDFVTGEIVRVDGGGHLV
jgi:pteridine reductase